MPVILALRAIRQEDQEFKASLDYPDPHLKKLKCKDEKRGYIGSKYKERDRDPRVVSLPRTAVSHPQEVRRETE